MTEVAPQNKIRSVLLLFTSLIGFGLAVPHNSHAQTQFTGYVRTYNAIQTTPPHEILIARNRVRLDLIHSLTQGEVVISNDLQNLYSASLDSTRYRLRTAYIDLYFPNSDLRIGRQMVVWGRADGTFITDLLTPVDLTQFLTQDFTDLRTGVTALSWNRYFGSNFLQLVVNPVFNPNEIPDPGSRWFPRSILPTTLPTRYRDRQISPTLEDMQFAARWAFRSNLNYDLDLGVLLWRYPSPQYRKDLVDASAPNTPAPAPELIFTETFTPSAIAFYSGTVQLGERWLLTSEAAYYHRRSFDYLSPALRAIDLQNPSPAEQAQLAQIFDQNRDGFLKERPWLNLMIGLQWDISGWTASIQLVNEHIFDYDDTILQEEDYYYATLLLQKSFLRDKFTLRTFSRYNGTGEDFWVNPELAYSGIDAFEASLGGHLFGGREPADINGHLSFQNYRENSLGYLRLTAYF